MSSLTPTFILQVQRKDGEIVRSVWCGGILAQLDVYLQTVQLENGTKTWYSPDLGCNAIRILEQHEATMTEVILPLLGLSLIETL